ncbi:MAG: copper resistance protein CopC [bacterium]
MTSTKRAWLGAIVLLCGTLLLRPAIAWAHAHLVKAVPAAGSMVSAPPTAIRLWFSEKPERTLTKVALTNANGTVVAVGPPAADSAGPLVIAVPVSGVLAPGSYTVTWSTAAADGHPSNGRFTFRVAASAAAAGTAPAGAVPPAPDSQPPSTLANPDAGVRVVGSIPDTAATTAAAAASAVTPAFIAVRAVTFAALLAMIGAASFRLFVLPRIAGIDSASRASIAASIASRAAIVAAIYVLAALVRLYLQDRMMTGSAAVDAAHLRAMSMDTDWGAAWRMQTYGGVFALVAFLVARAKGAVGWPMAAFAMVILALATTKGSHAVVSERHQVLSGLADTVHILGAGGWMGSLLWMALAALPIIQASHEPRAARAAALVHAFSPSALANAGVVGASGLVSAWVRLGTVTALWNTSYGQVLLVKLTLLAALAAIGFHNWKHVQPALGTDEATARLERSATLELFVGALVVVVTAILVATPTPT